jgi:hypothetical protein
VRSGVGADGGAGRRSAPPGQKKPGSWSRARASRASSGSTSASSGPRQRQLDHARERVDRGACARARAGRGVRQAETHPTAVYRLRAAVPGPERRLWPTVGP